MATISLLEVHTLRPLSRQALSLIHICVASKMFEALSNNNINIKMISTSEIKISCNIARDDADKAVSAIHDMLFD